jgi:hypothetical protein
VKTHLSRNHDWNSQGIFEIETGHDDARPGPGLRVCRLEIFHCLWPLSRNDRHVYDFTPFLCGGQSGPYEPLKRSHYGHGVHDICGVAPFVLETVFTNCLARLELGLRDRVGGRKRRKLLTAEMALTSAFESAGKGLGILGFCCDHLDALG